MRYLVQPEHKFYTVDGVVTGGGVVVMSEAEAAGLVARGILAPAPDLLTEPKPVTPVAPPPPAPDLPTEPKRAKG